MYGLFYHTTATNGACAEGEKGCYLASGSKDQTVRIWSTAKGKSKIWNYVMTKVDFVYTCSTFNMKAIYLYRTEDSLVYETGSSGKTA